MNHLHDSHEMPDLIPSNLIFSNNNNNKILQCCLLQFCLALINGRRVLHRRDCDIMLLIWSLSASSVQ